MTEKKYIFDFGGPMNNRIGVMINYDYGIDLNEKFKKNIELDIYSCQLCIWNVDIFKDKEQIDYISNAIKSTSVTVSALWAGYTGPVMWNFTEGPDTIGLVPAAYRQKRLEELMSASDFAEKISILATNDELREKMGRTNLRAIQKFSAETVVKEMKNIYAEELLRS
jgi:hypothetical protein